MDELTLIRRVRDDVPPPGPAALEAARERLLARAATRRRPPRRSRGVVAAAATAVVLVGAALVVTNPFARSASAAVLLQRASQQAGAESTPGPGQYLAVETTEDALGYVEGGAGIVGAYRSTTVSVTYVPFDRDGVWVRRSWTLPPGQVYGGEQARVGALRDYADSAHADHPNVERARAGAFGNGELGGGSGGVSTADIPDLPRDPQQLLDRLVETGGRADDRDVRAIQAASALLRSGLVPLDLRRSLYEALALLPDVRTLHRQTALDGRTGTAFGVHDGRSVWSVVIDTDSGDYLGDLQTQTEAVATVPAGTVMDRTSLRTTVVDEPVPN